MNHVWVPTDGYWHTLVCSRCGRSDQTKDECVVKLDASRVCEVSGAMRELTLLIGEIMKLHNKHPEAYADAYALLLERRAALTEGMCDALEGFDEPANTPVSEFFDDAPGMVRSVSGAFLLRTEDLHMGDGWMLVGVSMDDGSAWFKHDDQLVRGRNVRGV